MSNNNNDKARSTTGQGKVTLKKLSASQVALTIALIFASTLSAETVCDNGLGDWLRDSSSPFGVWCAQSTRIVQLDTGKYQPQFKDRDGDPKAPWMSIFENDAAFDSLALAQSKLRRAFETKKQVIDTLTAAFATEKT